MYVHMCVYVCVYMYVSVCVGLEIDRKIGLEFFYPEILKTSNLKMQSICKPHTNNLNPEPKARRPCTLNRSVSVAGVQTGRSHEPREAQT